LIECTIRTPLGPVTLVADERTIVAVRFADTGKPGTNPLLEDAAAQIRAYFAGELRRFRLPLAPPASVHQCRVREAMLAIAYGNTSTYGELAAAIGSSPRAVGQACGRNPLPIIVPCHRVVGAGGQLGGYSGGRGQATKGWLLNFEAIHAA
jgi:methylated-DNA-[protein]-cysteine S-methyltransferase